jgi:hypothetical protein
VCPGKIVLLEEGPKPCWCCLQDLNLKRAAFSRKQQAIKRAIAIGDSIMAERRRALAAAMFAGWRFRARVGREVQQRCARYLRGSVQVAWAAWRQHHAHKVRQPDSQSSCEGRAIQSIRNGA